MLKILLGCFKRMCRRRRSAYVLLIITWLVLVMMTARWLCLLTEQALLPPPPPDQNLQHFRRSRDLQYYLDHIELLIEPSSACVGATPVVVLVSSAPSHREHRQAIRETWGSHLPTYFVLGLPGDNINEHLADNYVEAKLHHDLIVYDMPDHYQNLTLKTMLMLQWSLERCARAEYIFKTDDDVLVNPWILHAVLEDHRQVHSNEDRRSDGKGRGIGYLIQGAQVHRDEYTKWFVPRWLYPQELVPEYLSGTGYILRGKELEAALAAAKKVPLINLEDVYLTYLVLKNSLSFELRHERRLSPYRPWLPCACAAWGLASAHSYTPAEIVRAWPNIVTIQREFQNDNKTCNFYRFFFDTDIFLY